jgi:hypothetical protein
MYEISGSHGDEYEGSCLLGCCLTESQYQPTDVSEKLTVYIIRIILMMEAVRSPGTSISIYETAMTTAECDHKMYFSEYQGVSF